MVAHITSPESFFDLSALRFVVVLLFDPFFLRFSEHVC
jgi:hypothetical protein